MVKQLTKKMNVEIIFEPGRMISGNAGILLSKVLYVKKGEDRNFLIIDAAMNDLLRPALYDAFHEIEPVRKKPEKEQVEKYDVVGPICESSDTFTKSTKTFNNKSRRAYSNAYGRSIWGITVEPI